MTVGKSIGRRIHAFGEITWKTLRPTFIGYAAAFYFVTDGIHSALERAKAAACDGNVSIGGGPATIQEFLSARLIDEIHLALRPIFLGKGEPLLAGLDLRELGYNVERMVPGERAIHIFIKKSD